MEVYTLKKPSPFHICLKFIVTTLVLISFLQPTSTSSPKFPKAYLNFIKTSCNSTTYPSLCYKTLSPYAGSIKTSYLKLCYLALSVTIKAARNTSTMVSNLAKQKGLVSAEASAIRDCIVNIQDSVDELQQTLRAMANLRGADKEFQLANAKTWASAAITDEDTCMEGFSGRKVSAAVKKKVKSSILGVSKLNSNALSLINHFNY